MGGGGGEELREKMFQLSLALYPLNKRGWVKAATERSFIETLAACIGSVNLPAEAPDLKSSES